MDFLRTFKDQIPSNLSTRHVLISSLKLTKHQGFQWWWSAVLVRSMVMYSTRTSLIYCFISSKLHIKSRVPDSGSGPQTIRLSVNFGKRFWYEMSKFWYFQMKWRAQIGQRPWPLHHSLHEVKCWLTENLFLSAVMQKRWIIRKILYKE